jgi:hypothetical protein
VVSGVLEWGAISSINEITENYNNINNNNNNTIHKYTSDLYSNLQLTTTKNDKYICETHQFAKICEKVPPEDKQQCLNGWNKICPKK